MFQLIVKDSSPAVVVITVERYLAQRLTVKAAWRSGEFSQTELRRGLFSCPHQEPPRRR
jgi:hypothetical protein